jgi:hypothetical protein
MNKQFQVVIADDVDTDEIWAELWLNGKSVLAVKPVGSKRVVSFSCQGTWIDTDLDSFTAALESCIESANQLAEPVQDLLTHPAP